MDWKIQADPAGDSFTAFTSAGGSLKNIGGTDCVSWGSGSGQNFTLTAGTAVVFNATTYTFGTSAASAFRTAGSIVGSVTTGVTGADAITNIMSLSQAEYDAITPAASTLYVIV